jgi:cytosine permease
MNRMLSFKVREEDRENGSGMALITMDAAICIPAFLIGGMLSEGLSLPGVVVCTLIGNLILCACACFVGIWCSKSGMPSTVISVECLGLSGSRFIHALLVTFTGTGWFGIQAAVCGVSFSIMVEEILGLSLPAWAITLFWGAVMTVSVMYGYRTLKYLNCIMAPVLVLVMGYAVIQTVFFSEAGSAAALLAWRPPNPMPYVTGISITVASWSLGAFTAGDYCRYVRTPRGAALGLAAGIIPAQIAVFTGGAIFRILRGNPDISAVLSGMGFPAMGLVFLIFATWTTNMVNLYSGSIAVLVLLGLPETRFKLSSALAGGIGTVLGAVGVMGLFAEFLSLLSSLVPPVMGVLVGAWITGAFRRAGEAAGSPVISGRPTGESIPMKPGFHIPGIIAYGFGVLAAWLTAAVIPFFIPSLNGILAAALVYIISEKLLPSSASKASSPPPAKTGRGKTGGDL